jgi:hypothetical protein
MKRLFLCLLSVTAALYAIAPSAAAQTSAQVAKAQVAAKVRVTAAEYDRLYAVNQIAAEQKFHMEMIVITGEVQKVSRTPDGKFPLLFLAGHPKASQLVLATLSPNAEARAATLQPPEKVRLVCVGGERVESFATLNLCSFALTDAEIRRAQSEPVSESAVRTWTRKQLSAWFKCPESFSSEEDSKHAFLLSIVWLEAQGQPITQETIQDFRGELLRDHKCNKP